MTKVQSLIFVNIKDRLDKTDKYRDAVPPQD